MQKFFVEELPNGLTLIGEPIEGVKSLAFSCFIPSGAVHDPEGNIGLSNLLVEMLQKGTASQTGKEFSDACDMIGMSRGYASGMEASNLSASLLSENLDKGLRLFSEMILNPGFPEEELESVKSLALQDLDAIEDEPASKIMEVLTSKFYPDPYSRSTLGSKEGIRNTNIEDIRSHYKKYFGANGSILTVAGSFSWDEFTALAKDLFGGWKGGEPRREVPPLPSKDQQVYEKKDTSQLQIALAYPSAGIQDPDYYNARVGVNVLSGGMSGRLFIEVREKRGLVYRVSAQHSGARGRSAVFASAGTTPENGEETLSVMLEQLKSIEQGVSKEELDRAKVDLKTRLIMQSESSNARASALASDWWNLGRLRTLSEVKAGVDAVTEESLIACWKKYPVKPVTLAVLGVKNLSM